MEQQRHYLAGVTAFFIWGFFSLPLRALKDFSAGEILYFRILFSALLLGTVLFFFRKKEIKKDIGFLTGLPKGQAYKLVALTLAGGLLLSFNWLVFIYIVNYVNVKTASFSYLICPVITAVLGFVLIKERLSLLQWLAVGLCALSCILIGMGSVEELGLSVATALSFALYLITQRKNQGFDRLFVLGVQILFALAIISTGFGFLVAALPTAPIFYGMVFTIAAVFTVLPLFLNLYALNKVNSATIGIIMYINPLLNFLVAFLVFDERISFVQLLGYIAILVGLVLFNLQNIRKVQAQFAKAKN